MVDLDGPQTILIVEDSTENITILGELLRMDYKIRVATNGMKALLIADSDNPPDLILLDVMMPEMDGYEVCKRLKENPRTHNIPVIFITAKSGDEDQVIGFEKGAVDYITKPFSPVVIKARVRTHMELKKYRDILEDLSYRDGLTGIANRRRFDEYYDTVWNLSLRISSPLSLIMIDIDHFKLFNDHYGHQAGDDCLIQVAGTLAALVRRKNDMVARYGGEEFVCILPNTDIDDANSIAEKFRTGILSLAIPHSSSMTGYVTISQGVASVVPSRDLVAKALIAAADEALYQAKNSGRNNACTVLLK